jgi:gamma-polyglutamate biosynthesis protein CapA
MMLQKIPLIFFCSALIVSVYGLQPQWQIWSNFTFYYGPTTTDLSHLPTYKSLSKNIISARLTSDKEYFDSMLFVGDVMLARNVEVLMNRHGYGYPYVGVNFSEYAPNPAVIGNFEASVPENHVFTPVNTLRFSVSTRYLSALRQANFTHLSLANNHTLDHGPLGFKHTVGALESADFEVFGHPTAVSSESFTVIEVRGTKVAVIGLHTLYSEPTTQELSQLFMSAKAQSELQIVFVHWGNEYELTHSKAQRRFAEKLVDLGADLIIGHHPHVVQGIELIHGVPVLYSLGNYIFDQYFSDEVQTGLMVQVEVVPDPKLHLLPVESATNWSQPTPMNSKSHQSFLRQLSERSAPSLRSDIERGVLPWYSLVATSSEIAMIE